MDNQGLITIELEPKIKGNNKSRAMRKGVSNVCAHLQCIWGQVRHVAGLHLSKKNVYDVALHVISCVSVCVLVFVCLPYIACV